MPIMSAFLIRKFLSVGWFQFPLILILIFLLLGESQVGSLCMDVLGKSGKKISSECLLFYLHFLKDELQ